MGNDVRASFVISQRKWRAFDAHHNFQNFQKISTFENFKIFESFENLKTLKLKILKNFENFDARLIRVLSPNFFWDFDKWRARVISHKKLFPQIRASFTHDARARQMRVLSRNFFWDVDKWRARVRCAEIRVFYHRPIFCPKLFEIFIALLLQAYNRTEHLLWECTFLHNFYLFLELKYSVIYCGQNVSSIGLWK